jgi:hypothetical protein
MSDVTPEESARIAAKMVRSAMKDLRDSPSDIARALLNLDCALIWLLPFEPDAATPPKASE